MKNKNLQAKCAALSPQSRREFMRKAMYASPVLLTLPAVPSFAQQGSAGSDAGQDPDPGSEDPCFPEERTDGQVAMCSFSFDPTTGEFASTDILVNESEVADRLAVGDLFGTCASIFCAGS